MKAISDFTKRCIYNKWRKGRTHKELAKEYDLTYHQVSEIIKKLFNGRWNNI